MNLKETARFYTVLKAVEKLVKVELARGKNAIAEAFDETGAKSAVAKLDDGTELATVTMAEPTPKPIVTHEADLMAWLKANTVGIVTPEHTVVVPEGIDGAALTEYLKTLTVSGGVALDENGEIIPGIIVRAGEPYPTVRFKPGGEAAIAAAWNAGHIDALLPVILPALTD